MWILTVFLLAAGGDRAVNSYGLFDSKEKCVRVSQEVGNELKEFEGINSILVCSKLKKV